jgi:Uma2 family endonuclease
VSTAVLFPEVTFEEYLAGEAASEVRHEWVAGRVYAMTGASERHELMAALLFRALDPLAAARGCRLFIGNRKIRLDEVVYYPDVLMVCPGGRPPDRLFERDLSVVVEVLSDSTQRIDRREKALAYAGAPSFERYLLVDPERRWIEVATPGPTGPQWRVYVSGQVIPELAIDVDVLYDALEATAVT